MWYKHKIIIRSDEQILLITLMDELKGFAPIGMLEYWNDGIMVLGNGDNGLLISL